MNLKKGIPGRGAGPRPDTFSYCSVAHGLKSAFNAWLAGPVYWAEEAHEHTERDPGTKPCLHWLTDGAVKCPGCRAAKPARCIGWCPLYRETDMRPVVVIVHESASDLLSGLEYPDYVLVGRVDQKSSVFVKRSDTRLSLTTTHQARKRGVDIVPDLLTMWNQPVLNEWLRGQRSAPAATVDTPPVIRQRLSVPPPTTRVEGLAIDAEKKAGGAWVDAVTDVLSGALKRTKGAERNGHHKTGEDKT